MKKLTPKEEDILSYFWTNGPLFIRELLELQEEPKPHYNTLSTIVRVLEEKGYIGYRPYGNTYQYYALVSEDEYRNKTLKNVSANKHIQLMLNIILNGQRTQHSMMDLVNFLGILIFTLIL